VETNAILEGLNPEQSRAVTTIEGPVLIVAGAGSGKTRVLTSRVAYLLEQGCKPWEILALTFTKKAAGEMKERIAMMVGPERARRVVMGTFHSVFIRFLREYAESLGYPKEFTIYDQSDSLSAIKACIKELKLSDNYKPKDIQARISKAKNDLYTPSAYGKSPDFTSIDRIKKTPEMPQIFALYQQKMKNSGVMDFDDILLNMNILLRDNTEALEAISGRFKHVLVDEYQDTNYAQYLILKKLAKNPPHNLCVVGDDSQSIYAFRGAKIQNILNFKKDYPGCKIIRLERNYRSTRNIVDAANSVIAHNEGRIPKKCYSDGEAGEKIHFMRAFNEQEEAMLIVSDIISRTRSEHAQYQDFAILYRTNSQSRALEEYLRRKNLPYMIYSGNSFFDRAEIKDLMAYFKLVVNPNDDESFKRVVNLPARGIGATSISALNECARAHGCSLFKAAWLEDHELYGLRPAAGVKIREFCRMIDSLAALSTKEDAYASAREIADKSGLYAMYKADTSIEGLARVGNLDELLNSVQAYVEEQQSLAEDSDEQALVTLGGFLEDVALLSNADTDDGEDSSNKIALMTVHSAKGLEFPYVYIAGAEENLFPSMSMLASAQDIEEERRLFYVALTRAKKAVSVSYADTRMRNGKHESNSVSRFAREIDDKYVANPLPKREFLDNSDDDDQEPTRFGFGGRFQNRYGRNEYGRSGNVQYFKRQKPAAPAPIQAPRSTTAVRQTNVKPDLIDPNFVAVDMSELYVGERIEHNRFGAGKILEISGMAPDMKAKVDFDKYGVKLLILKYAKLRPEKS